MDWSKGFEASYYATIVDRNTWRDVERFEITGGNIKRSDTGGSATIDVVQNVPEWENWIRVYLDAKQNDETAHIPLFTGLTSTPNMNIEGRLVSGSIDCYSVLKPAEDVLLDKGWYALAGSRGSSIIKKLLSVTPAPVEEEPNSPVLQESIVAEDNETCMSMMEKILTVIGWRLRINGTGAVSICPAASEVSASFDTLDNDSIEPSIDVEQDFFECPNVYRVVADGLYAVARDDNENSLLSTVNRGREVWKEEDNVTLNNEETIAAYARRRLKEEQSVAYSVKYDRRFNPDVVASDIVMLHCPQQNIDGTFRVVSQNVTLGYGGRTAEEVVRI